LLLKYEGEKMTELPQLTLEHKFAVRESQYAEKRAIDAVQIAKERTIQIVQGIARDLGVTEAGVMFQFDTLTFERHSPPPAKMQGEITVDPAKRLTE